MMLQTWRHGPETSIRRHAPTFMLQVWSVIYAEFTSIVRSTFVWTAVLVPIVSMLILDHKGSYGTLRVMMLLAAAFLPLHLVLTVRRDTKAGEILWSTPLDSAAYLTGKLVAFTVTALVALLLCWMSVFPFAEGQAGSVGGRPTELSRWPVSAISPILLAHMTMLGLTLVLVRLPFVWVVPCALILGLCPLLGEANLLVAQASPLRRDETSILTHVLATFPLNLGMVVPEHYTIKIVAIVGTQLSACLACSIWLTQRRRTIEGTVIQPYAAGGIAAVASIAALLLQYLVADQHIIQTNRFIEDFMQQSLGR